MIKVILPRKVQFLRPHVIHLMRGQFFTLEGHTFFTMGGASSHDVDDGILDPAAPDYYERLFRLLGEGREQYRIVGQSWWPEELPSKEEYAEARRTLDAHRWEVDYIITHGSGGPCEMNPLSQRFSVLRNRPASFFFGHPGLSKFYRNSFLGLDLREEIGYD